MSGASSGFKRVAGPQMWEHVDQGTFVIPPAFQVARLHQSVDVSELRVFINCFDGKDESHKDRALRMKLYWIMKNMTRLHATQLSLCQAGNWFQLLSLVTVNMQETHSSCYLQQKKFFSAQCAHCRDRSSTQRNH